MKTSKLLITSLLAAATLSVPAYADDVSGDVAVSAGNSTAYVMTDDTTFTFTNNPTLTGSISGAYTLTTSGNATLATGFGGTDDTRWTDGNLVVSAGTLQWGQGNTGAASANQTKALGKTISVSSGAALKIHLWTGKDLDTSTDGKVNITSKIILNGTSTLETADGSYYFSGGIQVGDGSTEGTATFRANWDKAIVISSLSGSGTMNFVGANTTWGAPLFSLGGNGGFSGTLNVTSTSLHLTSENAASGATLNIAGGASLYLDATTNNVKGLSGSGSVVAATAGNTLAIATETGVTNTFSGTVGTSTSAVGLSVSGSGTQTLAGTSYLGDVSVTGGSLSLGGTVSLANTVSVSGSASVSVNDSVIFILNDSYKADDTWTLISGGSSVSGWSNLTLNNFRKADGSLFSGRSGISVGTSGVVSITEGTSASLIWNGTSGNSTWNTSTTNKNWTNDNLPSEDKADSFYTLDNVTFKSLENVVTTVTLENGADIKVGDMTVESGDYTLNAGAGNSATISGSTLSVAKGASLQLSEQLSGANVSSLNLVFDDISLEGTLKVYTNAIDSWTKLTFAGDGAGTLYLYDIGGTAETTGLTISTMRMSAAGSIEAKWGGRVAISSLTGAGDLTINKPTDESSIYVISNMNGYSGKLITQGSGGCSLTVEISGSNSTFTGNIEVGSGTTVKMTGSGNVLGAESADRYAAVVKTGGTLNLNGNGVFNKIELAGGALVNNGGAIEKGKQQLSGLKLSANSIVGGTGNFGLVASQWAGNVLDLAGFTLTKTGSNEFLLASTTVKAGTIDVRQGTLTVMNGNSNQKMFSMEPGALIKLNGGTLKATVPTGSLTSVNLGDVAVVLTDTNKDTARITADSSCTFNAGNATLYLDIGALTETVLTGDEVALTIAGSNVISAENFFDTVLVGTYDSGDNWINDTEWAYKAGSWDAATGTLSLISVPEPSAFGLLAGAGALALVAARRRRTKRA